MDAERIPESRAAWFDDKFSRHPDPWRTRESWYEARKRALTLAALPRARYRNAFEPGCAIGVLSVELAPRCERLLCADFAPHALAAARARLAGLSHVTVEPRAMPHDWPAGRYDLIVISEFAYYLDTPECTALAQHASRALDADGTLVCCHWRHPAETWMLESAEVHRLFAAAAARDSLEPVVHMEDADFLLDVWSRDACSVARREGAC
ncbi:SAM-dependent methyltransferase [Paraburkholderia sp. J63]|uniref:SAM-dependent methyltransferase n=1 Tax=Paraburkholderia sp. J63 TaxID=2805434 RepID=UPI002ABD6902|nr:SAM-dependent methyltransferase [Paraburkholderia sp. J63]